MLADQEELARAELYGVLATLYQAPAPAALLAQLAKSPEPGLRAATAARASKEGASTILDTRWAELLERAGALPAGTVADEYDALFFAPVMQFDSPRTEITFAADYLDLPLRQTEADLEEFLKAAPAQLLVKFKNTNSLTSRIREVLKSQIGEEMPTLNDVASMLYLSPQTLRRRLAAEGKSYQGVKDALRRDAAIHLLLNPKLTLEDVAQQVGFSETSTFHRAFKKWTGVTPGLYRQLHGYH